MLIIFDLDDTLIDTSGCITPVKLADALKVMREEGLSLPDWGNAEEMILRLDEGKASAKETLIEFLEIHGADKRFLEIGLKEIYDNPVLEMPIFPVDGALGVLRELKRDHELAIVTVGYRERQLLKMEKAGLDRTLFCKIIATESPNKKLHYEAISQEVGAEAEDVLVLGDRVAIDLTPAKELGFRTVHFQHGRGRNHIEPKRDIDFTITHLQELKEIIERNE